MTGVFYNIIDIVAATTAKGAAKRERKTSTLIYFNTDL